jgi:hypothetical protein
VWHLEMHREKTATFSTEEPSRKVEPRGSGIARDLWTEDPDQEALCPPACAAARKKGPKFA